MKTRIPEELKIAILNDKGKMSGKHCAKKHNVALTTVNYLWYARGLQKSKEFLACPQCEAPLLRAVRTLGVKRERICVNGHKSITVEIFAK